MRGISEEELKKLLQENNNQIYDTWTHAQVSLLSDLSQKCKELNQWLPIDENTPKDKNFRLYCKQLGQKTGRIDEWSPGLFTHYQELPPDPIDTSIKK